MAEKFSPNTSAAKRKPKLFDTNATQAKEALASVERATAAVNDKLKMTRSAWRDFGAALLAQRKLMPDKHEFACWVQANELDKGLAKRSATRSDAIWLAEHWDEVNLQNCKGHHHPSDVRHDWRSKQNVLATSEHASISVIPAKTATRDSLPSEFLAQIRKVRDCATSIRAGAEEIIQRDDVPTAATSLQDLGANVDACRTAFDAARAWLEAQTPVVMH